MLAAFDTDLRGSGGVNRNFPEDGMKSRNENVASGADDDFSTDHYFPVHLTTSPRGRDFVHGIARIVDSALILISHRVQGIDSK